MVADGRLTAGHGRALLGLGNDRRIGELAKQAVEDGWSVREVEQRVQRARPEPAARHPRAAEASDPAARALEEELQRVLGTAVRIHRGRGMRGRIEIPFYGAEDFERVFEIIAGRSAAEVVS
jgi:ParB family chromosome partitioning protein